jgi:hypothetical protein
MEGLVVGWWEQGFERAISEVIALGLNSLARDGLDSFLPCAIGQVNSSVSLLELIRDVGELFDKAT